MTTMMIAGFRGELRHRLDGCMANVVERWCRWGRCAGGKVSADTLHMHGVCHKDAEQEHGQGQNAQHGTRTGAGPDHAPGRPSRNHAVILAARRQWSTTSPETPG
jgi:hypothetical protein